MKTNFLRIFFTYLDGISVSVWPSTSLVLDFLTTTGISGTTGVTCWSVERNISPPSGPHHPLCKFANDLLLCLRFLDISFLQHNYSQSKNDKNVCMWIKKNLPDRIKIRGIRFVFGMCTTAGTRVHTIKTNRFRNIYSQLHPMSTKVCSVDFHHAYSGMGIKCFNN